MKMVTSKDGLLTMAIEKNIDKIKSQRLIDAMMTAKRCNDDITTSELGYVAYGFQTYNRG